MCYAARRIRDRFFDRMSLSRSLLIIGLWAVLLVLSASYPSERIFLNVGTVNSHVSYQVYYFNDGYREKNSKILRTQDYLQGKAAFYAGTSFQGKGNQFRFDANSAQPFQIFPIVVSTASLFRKTYRIYERPVVITDAIALKSDSGLYTALSDDPQLHINLDLDEPRVVSRYSWDGLFALLFLILAVAVWQGYARLKSTNIVLPVFGFAALMTVVAALCWAAPLDHGPDEFMHLPSYFWYIDHLRPPSIYLDDPAYLNLIWQTSYILGASGDLTYLLTAKLYNLIAWMVPHIDTISAFRLAQFALILAGAGLLARLFDTSVVIAYLLAWMIVPQLSYTATYLNGDSLSFVLGFIGVALLIKNRDRAVSAVVIALFLFVNTKANYLVLVLLTPLLLWDHIRQLGAKGTFRYALKIAPFLPIVFYRRILNYLDAKAAGTGFVELAYERLLQNTDPYVSPFSLARASYERILGGWAYYDWSVLTNLDWYYTSVYSFFGIFGYMNFRIPLPVLLPCMMAFAVVTVMAVRGRPINRLIVPAVIVLALAASLSYSITEGYQAQGRYLFAVICVIFLLARKALSVHANRFALVVLPTMMALVLFR